MESIITTAQYTEGITKKSGHYHDRHQLLYIERGRVLVSVNGRCFEASDGCIVITGRFEQHSVTVMSEDYKRYVLRISTTAAVGDRLYSIFYNRPSGFSNVLDMNGSDALQIIKEIVQEKQCRDTFCDNMLELLLKKLLISLCRKHGELLGPANDDGFEMISALQRRLETEFYQAFSLEQLSRDYNMSVSYLSHSFKRITGTSVMNYLLQCRITAAKQMLTHSDMAISEIVDSCGFSDSSNFSRTFKQITKMSPSQFRSRFSHNLSN